jgi:hypothetical protein
VSETNAESPKAVEYERRDEWGPGPWDHEPNRLEWRTLGFPCLAVRNSLGTWCGYVAVPPSHPWHGKSYDDVDADPHGGLTFAGECSGHICHVPAPGEPADVWWMGFDCNHFNDLSPAMEAARKRYDTPFVHEALGTYRTIAFAKTEVERLAQQAAEAIGVKVLRVER